MRFLFKFVTLLFLLVSSSLLFAADKFVFDEDNTAYLRDEVSQETIARTIYQLTMLKSEDVYLFINSPGGSITAGFKLIQFLNATDKHVTCVASYAASMAFSILQACDERVIFSDSIIMQHLASVGNYDDIRRFKTRLELVDKMTDHLNKLDSMRLGMSSGAFLEKIRDDWWMFGEDAIKLNAADRIGNAVCTKELTAQVYSDEYYSRFGTAVLIWSACPLVTEPLDIRVTPAKDANMKEVDEWIAQLKGSKEYKGKLIVK